jgi:glutamate/tyrosine decarboxylase-like PLP-dependent enzyme
MAAMKPLETTPEQFLALSEQVAAIAAEFLRRLDETRIAPEASGEEIAKFFDSPLPEAGAGAGAMEELKAVAQFSRAQNGRFFGYVLGSGEPAGAATDVLCSVLNQNVTAWRSAPAAVTLEKLAVRWLAEGTGCAGFSGVLCGGGSAANLMGLAMAREAKAPSNERGVVASGRLAMYASAEVHMSIPKAIGLLGIGQRNLRLIPVDGNFRMITGELERVIRKDAEDGVVPVAIVGSAGTVKTGAIDPLRELAGIAREYGAWFHVDGAYGALAAIAAPELFRGMELADSLSLDPHKWLYQAIDCGCLLHRSAEIARKTFANSGDYVKVMHTEPLESFSFFDETVELSRRFRALKLWFSLRYHGIAAFREAIARDLRHARQLADLVLAEAKLELMAPVELSAVCFRYVGDGTAPENARDELNSQILARMVKRGRVYLSNATIASSFCLRACFVNHRTTDADVQEVIDEVLAAAGEIEAARK